MSSISGALEGLRILDLTGPEGHLCGRLLADLGAEVIKIEPPQGDPGRYAEPFKGNEPDPESSLSFINFNTNKKSVTLDPASEQGRQTLTRLARRADAIVETRQPGTTDPWDLDYEALERYNPGLVIATITGFGLSGPHSRFKAPSIVCSAMGGAMNMCGFPDRPPLAEPTDQPYHLAASWAAYGVLAALRHRDRTGRGQRVEVSCQEVQASSQHLIVNYSANAMVLHRSGSQSPIGGGMPYGIYPARDGHCDMVIIPSAHWRTFLDWIGNPESLIDPVWDNRHFRNANADLIEPLVAEFTIKLTKAEFFAQGQARHLPVAPVNRPDEFIREAHALGRALFTEVNHPVIGVHRLVGPPFRMSETPSAILRPAPTLGQHNGEIMEESATTASCLGIGARSVANDGDRPFPLDGVRVLDFSQALAGPLVTRVLAENGAEVIKVESGAHQQRGRSRPGMDPRIALQQKVTFADINRGKRAISVHMGTEQGRDIIRRLVPHCDVVVENFSPRVMEGWGLGYEELRKLRTDVIMARFPGFGLAGPYRDYVGMADVAMGITGMYHLWSYPDGPEPAGPPVWVPDYLSAAFGSLGIVAALRHRDRTSKGQLIDMSQVDVTATVLGTAYLDYFVNGNVWEPLGNGHRWLAPHGAYRCKGQDAWCVIAVTRE